MENKNLFGEPIIKRKARNKTFTLFDDYENFTEKFKPKLTTDDCHECGGEMEVIDGDYKCTGGDGYITPYEYTPLWEEKRCTHCGHTESDEPDFESRDY